MNDLRFFTYAFLLIGVGMLGYSGWGAYRASATGSWVEAQGTVVSAECRSIGPSTGGSSPSQAEYVLYRYTVAGNIYESDRTAFGMPVGSLVCTVKHKPGQRLAVYYDPAHPSEAVLERTSYSKAKAGIGGALGLIAFALLLGGAAARKKRMAAGQGGSRAGA